jgi:farnesyl-diphosphate farnesyltransferase
MSLSQEAMLVLEATSRTFYVPVSRLPHELLEAVASAYLCMRAIDEIEDHAQLPSVRKVELLRGVSQALQSAASGRVAESCSAVLRSCHSLPEVSARLGDWVCLAPGSIAPRIADATAAMADRMAYWASAAWRIRTEADLDSYTFSVAGAVGLLLSDLWAWHDGTRTNRAQAVGFGRGLQAVNIVRNRPEDLARGVDFFPEEWDAARLVGYARRQLALADVYVQALPRGPALDFCTIPLGLAYATLDALERGERKLSRSVVLQLIEGAARRPA